MADSIEHLIQAYGFLGAFFVLVSLASAYVLRRLLNKTDGIVTATAKEHISYLRSTATSFNTLASTSIGQTKLLASVNKEIKEIKELNAVHSSTNSNFETVKLKIAGNHAVDILEKITLSLELDCTQSLQHMREALKPNE